MANEFPHRQMDVPTGQEDEDGITYEVGESMSDVIENPDGSAIVRAADITGPVEEPDFYENMAETLPSWDMSGLGLKYVGLIEKDKEARKERDKQYEEGLKRTGMGNDAPGGAQ